MVALGDFFITTSARNEWVNITDKIQISVGASGVLEGLCVVFVPHTTAAVTVNETADPDVTGDITFALSQISPDRPEFRHREGNSDAHTKTSLVGPSITIIVNRGRLMLGKGQGIWLNEYDGPRTRRVLVRILGD
jgi:secondary thiamine-phosphate synthase enzyme